MVNKIRMSICQLSLKLVIPSKPNAKLDRTSFLLRVLKKERTGFGLISKSSDSLSRILSILPNLTALVLLKYSWHLDWKLLWMS